MSSSIQKKITRDSQLLTSGGHGQLLDFRPMKMRKILTHLPGPWRQLPSSIMLNLNICDRKQFLMCAKYGELQRIIIYTARLLSFSKILVPLPVIFPIESAKLKQSRTLNYVVKITQLEVNTILTDTAEMRNQNPRQI